MRLKDTPEYRAWDGMIQRCTNPKKGMWENYGGRGIKICDEWRASYQAFLAYVGPQPSPQHTIDRYPNKDGNYEPGNVRWATKKEQSRNRRDNVLITHDGQTRCVSEWSEKLGINRETLWKRFNRGEFPGEKVAPKPYCKNGHPLSGSNLSWTKEGSRKCKTCRNAFNKKYRQVGRNVKVMKKCAAIEDNPGCENVGYDRHAKAEYLEHEQRERRETQAIEERQAKGNVNV